MAREVALRSAANIPALHLYSGPNLADSVFIAMIRWATSDFGPSRMSPKQDSLAALLKERFTAMSDRQA